MAPSQVRRPPLPATHAASRLHILFFDDFFFFLKICRQFRALQMADYALLGVTGLAERKRLFQLLQGLATRSPAPPGTRAAALHFASRLTIVPIEQPNSNPTRQPTSRCSSHLRLPGEKRFCLHSMATNSLTREQQSSAPLDAFADEKSRALALMVSSTPENI